MAELPNDVESLKSMLLAERKKAADTAATAKQAADDAKEREDKLERELLAEQSKNRVLRYEWLLRNRCAATHMRYINARY